MTRTNLAKLPEKKKRGTRLCFHRDATLEKLLAATQGMANSHGSPSQKKDPKFRFSPLPLVSLIVATGGVIRRPCCPGFRKSSPFNQEPACRVITFHRCSGICTKPKHRPGLHATSPMQACIRPSFFSSEPNIEAPPPVQ